VISVPRKCPTGVQMESKLGFDPNTTPHLLAPLAPLWWQPSSFPSSCPSS